MVDEPHGTVKGYFLSSACWMVVGTLAGFIGAIELVAPDLLGNIPWIVFGRIRQVHTNLVMFGFVGSGLLGVIHYLVPTLVRAPLYSERVGKADAVVVEPGHRRRVDHPLHGYTQNREYAEMIWPIDIGVLIVLALIFYNLFQTLRRRKENLLYVSVWYIFGGLIFTFFTYFFGNAVWHPDTGRLRESPMRSSRGSTATIFSGFFFTTFAVAAAYYIIPIVSRTPLYSHTLSLIGFWSILLMYSHIGTHHLLQAPAPTWLKVIAITGSVGHGGSGDDRSGQPLAHHEGPPWKYLIPTSGEVRLCRDRLVPSDLPAGSPAVPAHGQRLTHFTNWVIAHAHMGVLGFSGMITLGAIYFILPRITGKPLFSRLFANLQYWLVLIGMIGFFTVLTTAGLIQGNGWLNGETVYRILPQIHLYMVLRAGLGILILGGAVIGLYNIVMSIYGVKEKREAEARVYSEHCTLDILDSRPCLSRK